MGIKRLFIIPVFALFTAVFGGLGDAYATGFSVFTTQSANSTFTFKLSARGIFNVNCDGGTLSGSGVSGTTIDTRNLAFGDDGYLTYTCTYSSGGDKVVTFTGGPALSYDTSGTVAAISFDTSSRTNITEVSGHIADVFPYLGSSAGQYPVFKATFSGAENLRLIDGELFYDLVPAPGMFHSTFDGCSSLTEIPDDLFKFDGNIHNGQASLFEMTFYGCSTLDRIPSNLFEHIETGANRMFYATFAHCTGLTELQDKLFGMITTGAPYMFYATFANCVNLEYVENLFSFDDVIRGAAYMFANTFDGCTSLDNLPFDLFRMVTTGAPYMFNETFAGCTGLTDIPSDFFASISPSAEGLFYGTFSGCTGLSSLSNDIFFAGNSVDGAPYMFQQTFAGCTSITDVDDHLFSHVTTSATGLFKETFLGCTSLETISNNNGYGLFGFGGNDVPGAEEMLKGTFKNCTSLGRLSYNLFEHITDTQDYDHESADSMFAETFKGCTSLTDVTLLHFGQDWMEGAESLFESTFEGCTSLNTLPKDLFANITTAGDDMFVNTFKNCTGLDSSDYIPAEMFYGLFNNNEPDVPGMMNGIFYGDTMATSCPSGTRQKTSVYDQYWTPKVVCETVHTYNVTYDCGSGNGTQASTTAIYGDPFTPPSGDNTTCSPQARLRLVKWAVSGTQDEKPAGIAFTYNYNSDKTLTAVYATAYRLGYDCNGGTGIITQRSVGTGEVFTPHGNDCSKSGYTQTGWTYNSDGSGDVLTSSNSYTFNFSQNKTLYAKWVLTDYTVTFAPGSAGGNTPTGSTTGLSGKHIGDTITLPASTFNTPSGYAFNGWNCDNSIGDKAVDATFSMPAANVTCTAQWAISSYPFSLTTTNLANGDTFQFMISAAGTFYVDCGTGGALSGTGVVGNTITKADTTDITYTCTYSGTGSRTVQFGGLATSYASSYNTAAISFASNVNIVSIEGNLSTIFPYNGQSAGQYPNFYRTFSGCTGLKSIPATLFSGYTTAAYRMFIETFSGCTGLGTDANVQNPIPATLFSNISSVPSTAGGAFLQTFMNCTGLQSLPTGLFSGVTTGAQQLFKGTFSGCTGLKSIPAGLFANSISTTVNSAKYMFEETFYGCTGLGTDQNIPNPIPATLFSGITVGSNLMFNSTFQGCTGLTSIPTGLFSNVSTMAPSLFKWTFKGCTGLTSIPSELFSHITTGANSLFYGTFENCTGLQTLPETLFSNVSTAATSMFGSTFSGCTGLTGYIPPTLFAGLINESDPTQSLTANYMMYLTFYNTGNLRTTTTGCPSGMQQFITGYESDWNTHISCETLSAFTITYYDTDCTTPLTGLTPTTYTASDNVTLPVPTRTGYTFNTANDKKWCTACGSGCGVGGWSANAQTGNKTLYVAQWSANNITVNFDSSATSCSYGGTLNVPTPQSRPGYVFTGWQLCSLSNLDTNVGALSSSAFGYLSNDGTSSSNTSTYGLSTNGTWAQEFSYGTIKGKSMCSSKAGNTGGDTWSNDSSNWSATESELTAAGSGTYCWCRVTDLIPSGGGQCNFSSPRMTFYYNLTGGGYNCATDCAMACSGGISAAPRFRRAMYGQ